MAKGKVKWFNADKGFGFIAPDDKSKDVFVHRNNIVGIAFGEALKEGEDVEYDMEETPKGLSAVNVERV